MISITTAELNALLAAFLWPLTRVLALIASAPVLGNPSVPLRVKIGLALVITLAVAPTLGPMPQVDPGSLAGLLILAQQVIIGLAMGFAMRIVFVAVEMAGELAGLQMGLGFATFFDPQNAGHVPVVGRFLGLIAILFFLAVNGHLQMVSLLSQSFSALPIGAEASATTGLRALVSWGGEIFVAGLLLSLPLLAALLITNLALGILTRAAPQLNIFAVGFPLTLAIGLLVMGLALPYFAPVLERMMQNGLQMMLQIAELSRINPR
ncbi:MAG: flagellar biosynthetic protein FliR [Gammaproteobacteria bacterium RIFCSPLOWO2_02_FULL_56_15]|nr:MAG: flagellar biosynthetic protein FliR [Gammaproteobacteria bacterium RIFCSPLOWO2_02_FULL_56_15]